MTTRKKREPTAHDESPVLVPDAPPEELVPEAAVPCSCCGRLRVMMKNTEPCPTCGTQLEDSP